jgi:hypothetical protein
MNPAKTYSAIGWRGFETIARLPKSLRDGVSELRIDWGPGYRVYYAMVGKVCVVLLGGGDKRRQSTDIDRAIENWKSWLERNKQSPDSPERKS